MKYSIKLLAHSIKSVDLGKNFIKSISNKIIYIEVPASKI